MELLSAIHTLQQIYPNGVMVAHINCYLGLDLMTFNVHIKELRRLLRKGYIVEIDTQRKPIYQKRYLTTQSGKSTIFTRNN